MMKLLIICFLLIAVPQCALADETWDPLDPSLISCSSDRVTISLPKSELTYERLSYTLAEENVIMVKSLSSFQELSGCKPEVRENDFYWDLDLTGDGASCMSEDSLKTSSTVKFVIYIKVEVDAWLPINLDPKVNFVIECRIPDVVGQEDAEKVVVPEKGVAQVDLDQVDVDFETDVRFYAEGFENPESEFKNTEDIVVGERIHLEYYLKKDYWDALVLQAKSCYASPYADPATDPKFYIINDWCRKADPLQDDLNEMVKNSVDHSVQFYFSSFLWDKVRSSTIYVHCELYICSTNGGNSCEKECPEDGRLRKRRSILNDNDDMSAVIGGKVVSAGPFNIAKPQESDNTEELELEVTFENEQHHLAIFLLIIFLLVGVIALALYRHKADEKYQSNPML